MNRRFLSMLLAMVMAMSMFASIPFTASAEATTVTANDWSELQSAVNNASSGQIIQPGKNITYTLPENGFTAPEGTAFVGWLINAATSEAEAETGAEAESEAESANALNPGDVIVVSGDTALVAQWQPVEQHMQK